MSLRERPRPEPDRDSAPWWRAVDRHELLVQRCGACGVLRFPARARCGRCRSADADWTPVSGRARVYTWTVTHQVFMRAVADEVPLTIVAVRLDEGDDLLMYGNLVDADPSVLRAGLAVEAVFADVPDGPTLVMWRPAERG